MRAFVTGGSGFIGLHVVERLVKLGDDVTCLVPPDADIDPLEEMGVTLRLGTLADPTTFADLCRTAGPALVHTNGMVFPFQTRALRLALPHAVPLVVQQHAEHPMPGQPPGGGSPGGS